jgi:predicted metal-binding membrane protein
MTAIAPAIPRGRRGAPRPVLLAIAVGWALAIVAEVTGKGHALHDHSAIAHGPPLWAALLLFLVAWQAMVAAMMLPSSLPLIRLFEATSRSQEHVRRVRGAFLAGYVVVWTGFGALAFMGDVEVHRTVDASWPWFSEREWIIGGGALALAGAFQFSDLKDKCLSKCRHPAPYLLGHYRRGETGAFRLGFGHGVFCLGCCWALMLVMFAAGVATLWWMAALTALMVYEKIGRYGDSIVRPAGAVLLGAAALQLAHPTWLPVALGGSKAFPSSIRIGPGPVSRLFRAGGYDLELQLNPNRAYRAGSVSLRLLKRGRPVDRAAVQTTFTMLDMEMADVSTRLRQTGPGTYSRTVPVFGMSGRWGIHIGITPSHGKPFLVRVVDRVAP